MAESRELFPKHADPQANKQTLLVLLDGMALIYRAHFALIRSPRFTSQGKCTSAIFGFCSTLLDLIKREQPTHLAVAFDTAEPTHRHEAFAEYKAQREEMPEELAAQIPDVCRLLEAMRIPILRMPGWEADDVLGTLAHQADLDRTKTYLVTPDKDYHQLVTEHVFVWKPGRQGGQYELLGVPEVLDRWKVKRIDQVRDVLGLMGDASDNIPGVPSIGEKTAQKLIEEYDSIENLLERTGELKGKRREVLEQHAEQARLSKHLVTIDKHVPLDVTWSELKLQSWDVAALQKLFDEWEFATLGKRMLGEQSQAEPAAGSATSSDSATEGKPGQALLFADPADEKTLGDVEHTYHVVQTSEERAALITQLDLCDTVCFDIETTGLDPRTAKPLGFAFSFQAHHAHYVVCGPEEGLRKTVLEELRTLFDDPNKTWIGHNLKYDLTVLKWHGTTVRGKIIDTMLMHTLAEPEQKHGMDFLAQMYLTYRPIPIRDLIGDPANREMQDVPVPQLAEYACEDADVTYQLWERLKLEVKDRELERVCYEVECPLIPVLVDMEHEGIRVDTHALYECADRLGEEIESLRTKIFDAVGHEFNIDSPKQLGVVLYEELQIEDRPKKTATGQYSTREAELLRLSARHPVVREVLEYRNAVKLKSVYVDQLPNAVDPRTGRIHTIYSQAWTATGRMQSNNPNLQTIPVRKERGREIRAAFVARDENHLLLSADYSQIELRIMAALSKDPGMLEAFQTKTDIHSVTAAKVYKVELDDVTREMRAAAKMVNFGIIYGISAFGLQQRLNIPREEASALIANYFEKYPGVQAYIDDTVRYARQHGYVTTMTGRRRYLRDINSRNVSLRNTAERLAMNSPIQGTAADMLKLAMIRVDRLLSQHEFQTKMLLTVHDEIVFDMEASEQETLMPLIEEAMRTALPLDVPVVVELGVGKNWLEAH
jgi:DNA polymerase-1